MKLLPIKQCEYQSQSFEFVTHPHVHRKNKDCVSAMRFCLDSHARMEYIVSQYLLCYILPAVLTAVAAAALSADDASAHALVASVGARVDAIFPTLATNAGAYVRLRLAAAAVALCLAQPQQQAVRQAGTAQPNKMQPLLSSIIFHETQRKQSGFCWVEYKAIFVQHL